MSIINHNTTSVMSAACKYSHDNRDLEILRKDPGAVRSLNVLDEIMEEIPSAYGTAAEAYSQQYQQY